MKTRIVFITGILLTACLLLVACGNKDTVTPLPQGYLATLVINNVAEDADDIILEVSVEGPADLGFGPDLLAEDENLTTGEGAVILLPTQDLTGTWDVQLLFEYRDRNNQRRQGRAQASFRDVIEGLTYTWNWAGYEDVEEAETGTIVITVEPDTAPWTLVDGDGTAWQGIGSDILYDVPVGTVQFLWEDVDGYITPDPAELEMELTDGGALFFLEIYAPEEAAEGEGEGEGE